jgi:hypothetical protein
LHHGVIINIKGNSYRLKGKVKMEDMNDLQNLKGGGLIEFMIDLAMLFFYFRIGGKKVYNQSFPP